MAGAAQAGQRALLIIDNQLGFHDPTHWGPSRSNPKYEQNVISLLKAFRASRSKPLIIHVVHHSTSTASPLHPSKGTAAIDPNTEPLEGEPIVSKNVNSAFIGTNLESMLREQHVQKLYITGVSTDHCVSTTTRMAGNLHVTDFPQADGTSLEGEIVLVGDATACFQKPGGSWDAETVHAVHVESLQEFATIKSTQEVLAEMAAL